MDSLTGFAPDFDDDFLAVDFGTDLVWPLSNAVQNFQLKKRERVFRILL